MLPDMSRLLPLILSAMILTAAGCASKPLTTALSEKPCEVVSDTSALTELTPYDAAFLKTVEKQWCELLDAAPSRDYRKGVVIVAFHLPPDGTITDAIVKKNTSGMTASLISQKAIADRQPYGAWLDEMKPKVEKGYRELEFSFLYK